MSARDAIAQILQQRSTNQGISSINKGGSKLLGTPSLPVLSPLLPKSNSMANQKEEFQTKHTILSVKNRHNAQSIDSVKKSFANAGSSILQNSNSLTTLQTLKSPSLANFGHQVGSPYKVEGSTKIITPIIVKNKLNLQTIR